MVLSPLRLTIIEHWRPLYLDLGEHWCFPTYMYNVQVSVSALTCSNLSKFHLHGDHEGHGLCCPWSFGLGAPPKVSHRLQDFPNGSALYKKENGLALSKMKFQTC